MKTYYLMLLSFLCGIQAPALFLMITEEFPPKPRFEVNDCLLWTYKNEFETHKWYTRVLKVGKTSYKLGRHENERYPDVQDFETVHRLYEKIDCSQMDK